MTLSQALALVHRKTDAAQRRRIFLACGFEPLHLVPFLQAHFAERFPDKAAEILTGTYGDIQGALAKATRSEAEAAAVVIEWSDLDPRLGLRSAGGWAISIQADIQQTCRERFARILEALRALVTAMPVALVPPTLPLQFLGHTGSWQSSPNELELQKQIAIFLNDASTIDGVSVLNSSSLSRLSPEASRLDPLMELRAGFPYTIAHASAVARQVVKLLFPPAPMKGLITDLDETFWSGIVGEAGAHGVSWSQADHTQIHGLYQQMLGHLSEMGVLLAMASKNELTVVEEALRRDDLLVPGHRFFPVIANWGPKSHSVGEILRTWNIGPESVVFVDDSAMEIDEVQTAFPAMTCLHFSTKQPARTLELFETLRDLFGKPAIHREDALRQASIRANAAIQPAAGNSLSSEFVHGLQGRVTFDCRKDPANKRLLELINKTNQFNLNGVRLSEGEWLKVLEDENSLAVGVSYEDKFGPLGTIGVLAGRRVGGDIELTSWVLSCRAFSRKIEHHMLDYLFSHLGAANVRLAFRGTDRNQPLRQHLDLLGLNGHGSAGMLLRREQVENYLKDLPHEVRLQS